MAKALRLSMLGWTQAEIAERLGVAQKTVSDDLSKNFGDELFTTGHTPDEIALRLVAKQVATGSAVLHDQLKLKLLTHRAYTA